MKQLSIILTILIFIDGSLLAQTIPVKIVNHSDIADDSIFVAIIGQQQENHHLFLWVDKDGTQRIQDTLDNTVYHSPQAPGQDSMFANCFFPLSEITDNTILLHPIIGGRVWISENSQLFMRFLNQPGDTVSGGFTQPNITNPTDPNLKIIYEYIEFTSNNFANGGLFYGNNSRVDAYRRPVSLEVKTDTGNVTLGDSATHSDVIAGFKKLIINDTTYKHCLDTSNGVILQFSKTEAFFYDSIGRHYFKSHVDAIWAKYKTDTLKFKDPNGNIWSGLVDSYDTLTFTGNNGQVGQIASRPTTLDIWGGQGVLAQIIHNIPNDKNVQKWMCAAFHRGVIDITNADVQDWNDTSKFYKTPPFNHYAGFWHQPGISIDRLAYGFSYDDVGGQSSSLPASKPDSIIIHWGWNDLGSSSVSEAMLMQPIKVYPNITSSRCTVSGLDRSYLLNIIDLNGQLLESIKLSPNLDKIDLDLSNYSNGLYFIQVHSKNGIGIAKVIRR